MLSEQVRRAIEQSAKEYWNNRQQHAATAPHFSLCQDPPILVPTSPSYAHNPSTAIPIRLDLEADGAKLREAFLWRPDDPLLTPQSMSTELCDEFGLERSMFQPLIQQSLIEQSQDYSAFLDARRQVSFKGVKGVVKIDIVINSLQYEDSMLVDLDIGWGLIVQISEQTCRELVLPREFEPALSFTLREQQYQMQRALLAVGWSVAADGKILLNSTATDPELTARLQLDIVATAGAKPTITELSAPEVEKLEMARERDGRRKRRQTRGRRDAWALGSPPKLHPTNLNYRPPATKSAAMDGSEAESESFDDPEDEVYRRNTLLMHGIRATNHPQHFVKRKRGRGRPRMHN